MTLFECEEDPLTKKKVSHICFKLLLLMFLFVLVSKVRKSKNIVIAYQVFGTILHISLTVGLNNMLQCYI